MDQYTKKGSLENVIKIQAIWKGFQIRRIIQYLKTTQKVHQSKELVEPNKILYARRSL